MRPESVLLIWADENGLKGIDPGKYSPRIQVPGRNQQHQATSPEADAWCCPRTSAALVAEDGPLTASSRSSRFIRLPNESKQGQARSFPVRYIGDVKSAPVSSLINATRCFAEPSATTFVH